MNEEKNSSGEICIKDNDIKEKNILIKSDNKTNVIKEIKNRINKNLENEINLLFKKKFNKINNKKNKKNNLFNSNWNQSSNLKLYYFSFF